MAAVWKRLAYSDEIGGSAVALSWFYEGGGGSSGSIGATMAEVLSNKLSAFAATTSAELKTVISDETGSGALVFATSPTLVTPTLGAALATSLNVGACAAITEAVEANGAISSQNYSSNWAAGAERAMFDYDSGNHFGRFISTSGLAGANLGFQFMANSNLVQTMYGNHSRHIYPFCLTGALPSLGLNAYHDGSVWKLAIGTAKYGGYITVDSTYGTLDYYSSETSKNADQEITPLWQFSIGSSFAMFPRIGTTASGANAFLDSTAGNSLKRSTSSLKYKQDIINLTDEECAFILKLRPITFRSKCEGDDPDKRHFGLIAEEVAELDTKTVNFHEEEPDGLQYDRLIVPLIAYIQKLEKRVSELEERLK